MNEYESNLKFILLQIPVSFVRHRRQQLLKWICISKATGIWLNTENMKGIGSRVTFFHRNNLSQKATVGQFKSTFFHTSFQVSKNMS